MIFKNEDVAGISRSAAYAIGSGIVMVLLPLALTSAGALSTLSFVAIFGLVAYSVSVSFRYGGTLMIAQGSVWGTGAYTGALLHSKAHWNFWAVLPVAAIGAAVAATVIGLVALRARGHYFLIVTFVINELLVLACGQVSFTGGQQGIFVLDNPNALGPITFNSATSRYYLYVVMLAIGIAVTGAIGHTGFGRRLISIRENDDLARSIGIGILRTRLQAFALGGLLAGVAGVLYAYQQHVIAPQLFSTLNFLQIVLMLIIGGSSALLGPLVGALLLLFLPQWLNLSPQAEQVTYGVLLVLIILLAPQGVVGTIRDAMRRAVAAVRRDPPTASGPASQVQALNVTTGADSK